ncbi:MFS transporter [Actinomadura opuntiae]|uniref:MFS transporter n=1 Tax=Actinomadura sp. OS1-43 TaxID=604315 RepID=UPI00255B0E81|nr:MFS transporter [Actinomadura sp. OS1-43]MDL4814582.1 MFS transporter [Actinomadura sp. OS1-43]
MTIAPPQSNPRDGGVADDSGGQRRKSWHRDFKLLLGGSALSQLGTLGAAAASPLLALTMTGSPIVAGWVTAASTLPGLFLHLPAGLIVDRYDRWWIMFASQAIRVVNSALLFVALLTVAQPWPFLLAAIVVDGACAVFFRIAELAAVRYVVPDGQAERAMGTSEARHHVALVLGRPIGGLLFTAGRVLPYLLDAVTSIISVFALLRMNNKKLQSFVPRPKASRNGVLRSFREGVLQICRDRFLYISLAACAVANMAFQVVILLLVVEAERRHFSGSVIGALLATSGVSGFLGAVTAPGIVRRFKPQTTVKWCVVSWFPLLGVVAMSGNPLVGMCAWGLCSFMGAYINVALAVHQSRVVPKELQGRVEGVVQFLTTGAVALGACAGGYVIDAFGTRTTAAVVALMFLGIAVAVPLVISQPNRSGEPTLLGLILFLGLISAWWLLLASSPERGKALVKRGERARGAGAGAALGGAMVPAGEDG